MTRLSLRTYVVFASGVGILFFLAANTSVVLNGTSSLPHNGYLMLRQPLILSHGAYVAFDAPEVVKSQFEGVSFVKRIVGRPGDVVSSTSEQVCVNGECRVLQEELVAKGLQPLPNGVIASDEYVVFGDSEDSLDSRYQIIGTVKKSHIQAVGWPINIPHWRDIRNWLQNMEWLSSWIN